MEIELSLEQQQALKYFTFIGDPTASLKCLIHQNQCKNYCKGCHAPICQKCIQNHHNSSNQRKDPTSSLSMHKIVDIEQYAKDTLDSYIQAFLEIEDLKNNKKDYFDKRESLFKRECRNFITKLHKFISHFLMQAQEHIFKTIDEDYAKWELQKEELTSLRDSENFNELFLRRKEIQKAKKEMKIYHKDITSQSENNVFDDIKLNVCNRGREIMDDLQKILDFALDENNLSSFDDILDSTKVEEIQIQIAQRKHLLEPDRLKEKLSKLKDNLNFVLKEIDSVGLSNEYNTLLDETLNPDLKSKFERIERLKGVNDSYVYYGQINQQGQMHGIGNMLFKNGFCYQGMFNKGSRDGLGFTFDLSGNKYKGEHRKGIREGQGIFKTNDGKIYEGGWSNNKMHGRGRETFQNGECFIVYYKNGYKLEALASKSQNSMLPMQDVASSRDRQDSQSVLLATYLKQNTAQKNSSGHITQVGRDSKHKISGSNKSVILQEELQKIRTSDFNKSQSKIKQQKNKNVKTAKKKTKNDGDCLIF